MYRVYVLKSEVDSFHYIGHTADLEERLRIHNRGRVRSTKSHRPFKVIYSEEYSTKSEAQTREYFLKRGDIHGGVCEHNSCIKSRFVYANGLCKLERSSLKAVIKDRSRNVMSAIFLELKRL